MPKRKPILALAILPAMALLLAAGPAGTGAGTVMAAEADAGDAWLWADPNDLFSLGEDDLFGGGLFAQGEEAPRGPLDDAVLFIRGVDVGGSYNLSARAQRTWQLGQGGPAGGAWDSWVDAAGSFFVDYRPNLDFRAFAKLKGDVRLAEGPSEPGVSLHELFVDFTLGERVFVRAGKQTVNWGVGYFFSPADIINIGRLDPEAPEAEREGPVAVRVHLPAGRNNYYAYAVVDGTPGDDRIALAPKTEFVYGRSEVGLGLYYRADRVPRAMATLSTSLFGRLAVFGEAVFSKGSDKRFVREVPVSVTNPWGLEVYEDPDTLRLHLTAGVRGTYSDPDGTFSVTAAGQYFYNGEGYDEAFLKEHRMTMLAMAGTGALSGADVSQPGRHYAALSISGTTNALRNWSPGALWLGNLGDGSGMITLSLGYTGWRDWRPSISVSHMYGSEGSEFALAAAMTQVTVGVSFGKSW